MKKLLPIFSIAIVMAACNSNPETIAAKHPIVTQATTANVDTFGFAQFQQIKAQNELVIKEEPKQEVQYIAATPVKKVSAPIKKLAKNVATTPKPIPSAKKTSESPVLENMGNESIGSESAEVAKEPVKEGWSKAAKGAVIGGAGGAIAGAVLNKKNRAVGAVIGGVLGAGGGYVIGRGQDKKDGRIEISNN